MISWLDGQGLNDFVVNQVPGESQLDVAIKPRGSDHFYYTPVRFEAQPV